MVLQAGIDAVHDAQRHPDPEAPMPMHHRALWTGVAANFVANALSKASLMQPFSHTRECGLPEIVIISPGFGLNANGT